jgi:hypothetical protein
LGSIIVSCYSLCVLISTDHHSNPPLDWPTGSEGEWSRSNVGDVGKVNIPFRTLVVSKLHFGFLVFGSHSPGVCLGWSEIATMWGQAHASHQRKYQSQECVVGFLSHLICV